MKKDTLILAAICAAFVSSCGATISGNRYADNDLVLHTDSDTGCQYLVSYGLFARSITPRLDGNGNPICNQDRS